MGLTVGDWVGVSVIFEDLARVGLLVVLVWSEFIGDELGALLGLCDGEAKGDELGTWLGLCNGEAKGDELGALLGLFDVGALKEGIFH